MARKLSQAEALLLYLRKHPEGIDRQKAKDELGIYELPRRICDLRQRGIPISAKPKSVPSRYNATRVKVYTLELEEERKAPEAAAQERPPDKDSDGPAPAPSETAKSLEPKEERSGQGLMFGG